MTQHIPVLLEEVKKALDVRPGMIVVDATLGGGGYGRAITQAIAPEGIYVGIDRDAHAVQVAQEARWVKEAKDAHVSVVLAHRNYSDIRKVLAEAGIGQVDAIVADLGLSSDQLDDAKRGLSFRQNGTLDMRLDQTEAGTAMDIVNHWSADEIARILRKNAQESFADRIARRIVEYRKDCPIETTGVLAEIVRTAVPQQFAFRGSDPATKTFMALRMEVNRELEHLKVFLCEAIGVLAPGGRIAVVTFHSGEDSIVKHFFVDESVSCVCPPEFPVCRCEKQAILTKVLKKAIVPTEEEVIQNPRSRSARLRLAEKNKNI